MATWSHAEVVGAEASPRPYFLLPNQFALEFGGVISRWSLQAEHPLKSGLLWSPGKGRLKPLPQYTGLEWSLQAELPRLMVFDLLIGRPWTIREAASAIEGRPPGSPTRLLPRWGDPPESPTGHCPAQFGAGTPLRSRRRLSWPILADCARL